jgi:hypothetical protein
MRDKIKGMVETYIKQLSKKTKSIERQSNQYLIQGYTKDHIWLSSKNDIFFIQMISQSMISLLMIQHYI